VDDIIWGECGIADDRFAAEKNIGATGIWNDESVFLLWIIEFD